jgi:hypothetical protein
LSDRIAALAETLAEQEDAAQLQNAAYRSETFARSTQSDVESIGYKYTAARIFFTF